MEIIFKSNNLVIQKDAKKQLLHIITKRDESGTISQEQIEIEIKKLLNFIIVQQPKYLILDHSEGKYAYRVEEQRKLADLFAASCNEAGVKKFAIISSQDIFVDVSIQQVTSEATHRTYEIKMFQDVEEAKKWLEV